jgi:cell division transport system permease protein
MLRRRSDLPLDRDPSGRFLPWLVAVMVFLAALAMVCAMAMNKVVQRWDQGLSGSITVQIPPPAETSTAAANEMAIDRIIDILLDTDGIIIAEVLEPDEIAELLKPWLGTEAISQDLPLPMLIAVVLDPRTSPDLGRLARQLDEAVPGTLLDDHQSWLGELLSLARSIELLAALVLALVGSCAIAMVIFATRMGLAIHGQIIELLHLIGAQDSYVAAEFQSHALKLALRGGVLGLMFALITLVAVGRLMSRVESALFPEFSLQPLEWSLLALLPLAIALVAMLTARWTVLRTLGRMP